MRANVVDNPSWASYDALLRTDPFEVTFESARVGLAIVDLQGRFLRVNDAYAALVGMAPEDLVGSSFTEDPDQLRAMVEGRTAATTRFERELRPGVWVLQDVTLAGRHEGAAGWFVVDAYDITDRRRAEADLAHRALHDQLTGLPNRVLVLDRLALALARARRSGGHVGVLFCDLDGFKQVNDRLGHAQGDRVLQAVAARLDGAVRPSDTVARLGGDEFVVVVEPPVTPPELRELISRLEQAVASPLEGLEPETPVGVSVGAVLADPDEWEAEAVLARADAAMYARKQGRRAAARNVAATAAAAEAARQAEAVQQP